MKTVTITVWDDSHGAIEYVLGQRTLEIVKDCLEAGLEAYEDDPDAEEVRDITHNL